jgi:prefoldin subunit 5
MGGYKPQANALEVQKKQYTEKLERISKEIATLDTEWTRVNHMLERVETALREEN